VLMENHPCFFEIFWAAQRSGLYFTPLSWRFKPDEVAYILRDSGAKALFSSSRQAELARGALGSVDIPQRFAIRGTVEGFEAYDAGLGTEPTTPITDETLGRDMLYSSGTTGRPKGVENALPDGAIMTIPPVMAFLAQLYSFDEHTILLTPTPLYHA